MSETPHPHAHTQHHHARTPPDSDGPNADTYETANKRHFDATAHQYDDHSNAWQARAEKTGQAIKDTGLFKRGVTTVMDFACGTGESVRRSPFFFSFSHHSQRQSSHFPPIVLSCRPHLAGIGGRGPQVDNRSRHQPRDGRSIQQGRCRSRYPARRNESHLRRPTRGQVARVGWPDI